MHNRTTLMVAALLAAAAPLAAQDRVVNVVASNYKFDAPDSIPAGRSTFHLVTQPGGELHHLQIVKLEQGRTMQDFAAAMNTPGPVPAWVTFVGGPNASVPDGQTATTVSANLAAGDYVLLCLIPGADGKPHVTKGMARPLRVTAARGAMQSGAPTVDATLTLFDYNFDFDKPLAAGRRTIAIRNSATQFHEAFLVKLPPHVPLDSLPKWVAGGMQGMPPVIPEGGIVGISPGQENWLMVNLEPGDYALYCFLPDAKDGKEHVQHGMMKQFTVR